MKGFVTLISLIILLGCQSPQYDALVAKTPKEVRALKGRPTTIIREQDHEMWTYRRHNCTEIVFFDKEKRVADFYEKGSCAPDK